MKGVRTICEDTVQGLAMPCGMVFQNLIQLYCRTSDKYYNLISFVCSNSYC